MLGARSQPGLHSKTIRKQNKTKTTLTLEKSQELKQNNKTMKKPKIQTKNPNQPTKQTQPTQSCSFLKIKFILRARDTAHLPIM